MGGLIFNGTYFWKFTVCSISLNVQEANYGQMPLTTVLQCFSQWFATE